MPGIQSFGLDVQYLWGNRRALPGNAWVEALPLKMEAEPPGIHSRQSPGTRKFKYMYRIWVTDIIVQWCRGNPSVVALVVIRMRYLFRIYTRQRITTRAGTEAGPYHISVSYIQPTG